MLKNISPEEKFRISARPRNVLYISKRRCNVLFITYLLHKDNEIPNHFALFFMLRGARLICSHSNADLFTCEDNMLFLLVNIS